MSVKGTPAEAWSKKLSSPAARLIDGVKIGRAIEAEVIEKVNNLTAAGLTPHLATLQVGDNPAAALFARNQKKRLSRLGIQFTHLEVDERTDQTGVLSLIRGLNDNPTVTGILVTSPVPESIHPYQVRKEILPQKDVEGLSPSNLGNLLYNRSKVGPCTPLAVLEAIQETSTSVEGRHAVIVGHSDTVGKPLTLYLLADLATTTTCHIATEDLKAHTQGADILVVAVGKPGLIQADMVKPGAIVLDIGINRVAGSDGNDTKIVGDVDFEAVAKKASWITPVPGGIGPITVAMLARNIVICAQEQLEKRQIGH